MLLQADHPAQPAALQADQAQASAPVIFAWSLYSATVKCSVLWAACCNIPGSTNVTHRPACCVLALLLWRRLCQPDRWCSCKKRSCKKRSCTCCGPCLCSAAAAALQLTGMLPCSAVYLCLGTLQATAACQTGASHPLTKTAKGSISQEWMASSSRCGPTYQRPQSVTKGDGVEAVRKWACFASALCSPFVFGNLFQRLSKSWQASTVIDIGAYQCTCEENVAAF